MTGLLIDIEKFVRQLLPPNRRLPKHIALATVLLKPLEGIINQLNEFIYNTQFDTGTPGQRGVMEFLLQSYIHPAIKVLDADGVKLDFRVLVPEGLSLEKKGDVTRLVERCRLKSKRYDVADSIDWGNGGTDPVTGLAFLPGLPKITVFEGSIFIEYGVNQSGLFPLKIHHIATGQVFLDGITEFSGGSFVKVLPFGGAWGVQIATLFKAVNAPVIETVTTPPDWLNALGMTNDTNSRDTSIYIDADVDCILRIESIDGLPISGYTWNNKPWANNSDVEGTTEWVAAPWSEVFRLNPPAYGLGGLVPGKDYRIFIVRAGQPSPVFTKVITMPTSSHIEPIRVIELTGPVTGQCERGPLVDSIVSASQHRWVWNMDAAEVFRLRVHAKNMATGQIVQSKEIQVANLVNGVPVGVFNPSWRIFVDWDTPLAAGNYQLGTEGVSCSSGIHWSPQFTVVNEGTGPVDPEEDQIELALYFSASGTAEMKARAIGTAPYSLVAFDEQDNEIYSTQTSDQEIEIPNAVVAALGNDRIKVQVTDAAGKSATRHMAKIVRDRERIVHAFHSVSNGNVQNHKDAINQGDRVQEKMTATAVIFGEIDSDAGMNTFLTTDYVPGADVFPFDGVIDLVKTKTYTRFLKVGVYIGRGGQRLNNGTTITEGYGVEALIMRPGGTTPTSIPGGPFGQMIPSPAHPQTRAYAKKLIKGFGRRYYDDLLAGHPNWLGIVIGPSGEAEYPTHRRRIDDSNEEPNGEVKGDFNPVNVALFKQRYPQHANRNDDEINNASWGSQLDLDWKEHHAVVYAEFEAEVYDDLYEEFPALRYCQLETIDVGSAVDGLAPKRHTLNIRRRIRPTTGMIKMNDNPHSGDRMRFIAGHAKELGMQYGGCTVAFEPSPTDPDFGKDTVRQQILAEVAVMKLDGISWSHFNHTPANNEYLLNASAFNHGQLRPANQQYKVVGGVITLPRLVRNISDIFTSGGFDGWESAYIAFANSVGVNRPATVSFDNLYVGGGGPGPDPDPDPDPDPQLGDYQYHYTTECFPGDMKLDFTPLENGLGFYVTDFVDTQVGGDKEVSYVINGKLFRGVGRLVNYEWYFPATLSLRKVKNRIGIPALWITGNGHPDAGDLSAIEAFYPHNTSYAQIDLVYVKQNG